ncbi:3D-(3,5/4)-trihydroxycyclohexane-1,2-dione acylhydrolase (decyclizing) [Streptomyces sp. NBC_00237]|uniref:3D-(3,5/4)-trihydroxycyclohexane-1,2-dione acylhydrolase (decyclizing) n=1 Tax=Streptomyces sp. NBC_00237 TaxID=2975687 RepID=UPI002252A666|nr:3D-(3,5/4)-trihydroxycyclohexane-1,2-dione acylhydrolase (decyclizing) [Streptomyces sp. NBC_00237]MCX5201156.1 3D-(3,5/4)-trihydroxycyclohexane-1,2-dione acylhydrolase (decyclizing) [Streptomyces sp. NBC_00237]
MPPPNTRRLTTAQALLTFLTHQFTEHHGPRRRLLTATWGIFGHGNVAGLGQALTELGPDRMPFHQGRNEQAMVHAATAYARHSNRLSAHAVTTSIGPGATNLVTGAALATVNRLPVLLLPGDTFATRPADPVLQQLEVPHSGDVTVNDCLRPVSAYFDRVTRPEALIPAALAAMRVLADPAATGSVTLCLPQDVQTEAYDWPQEFFRDRVWRVRAQAPDPHDTFHAAKAVRAARRPLLVAGGGVRHSRAQHDLARFATRTGIPVASTQAGKGSLPYDHPADVGGIGHTGTAAANHLARTADLVIGVGTRWTDFTTASRTLFQNPEVRFVNLNITDFDAHKLSGLALVGDAGAGLRRLGEELRGKTRVEPVDGGTEYVPHYRTDEAYRTECRTAKGGWERHVDAAYAVHDDKAAPTQAQVLGVLDTLVTPDDILINAAGSLPGDLHKLWRTRSHDQYHVEYGYSCMGYEIPAAIGVQLAAPDRPVWALVGDGTYLMNPTEIVTAVQERLPIKVVILDNRGYASIGGLSETVGAERFGTDFRFRAPDGTYTGDPLPLDLAANAASLGMRTLRAETIADLREALQEARASTVPTCVYVRTETGDTVSGPATGAAWWDVPVAETATRPSAVLAREQYDRHVAARRHHL